MLALKTRQIGARPRAMALSWLLFYAAITIAALCLFFYQAIEFLFREWTTSEYSHGMLIPLVSLAIAWLKREEILANKDGGSWIGVAVLLGALALALVGQIATIYLIVHFAIVIAIIGATIAFLGWRVAKILWFPFLYLFFMIPLPDFFLVKLSGGMQLLSSSIGVWFIRLFDLSVFLDGNVIDLGDFKMQVVEACNGLRYLFPLMSFGFLIAYLYQGPGWQRALVFLSTIPLTILMNSIRIGLIGVLYAYYGVNAATGFLHDFEGWAVFIVCITILLIEVKLLSLMVLGRPRITDMFVPRARKPTPIRTHGASL
jgi:exosortase D (VPLPA-CTERM-specific)